MMTFPEGFVWGAATSAFQVEGAAREDGKAPSIWDTHVHKPGTVRDGSNADIAADSYHRWREDIECLNELGADAYRFSISWPRVIPDGRGPGNQKGFDYYNRLIDALLENGITPYVTLYHWDLPQALEDQVGWESREMAGIFADYAGRMVAAFGDRVTHWLTFNEMHALVDQGYGTGTKAPGKKLPEKEVTQVYHHVLLAHGKAVRRMRAERDGLQIGTAENPRACVPVVATEENIRAARIAWDRQIGFLFEPMYNGRYPDGLGVCPDVREGDMETIRADLDLVGLNFYFGTYVEASDEPPYYRRFPWPEYHPAAPSEGWIRMIPEVVYWGVRFAAERYDVPAIYVFENGFPLPGDEDPEQNLNDVSRIMFVRSYLTALHRAVREGYPVKGYFYWTLMDSFEWASGFGSRFGLYRTDFETLERTPRLSARWYGEVAARNAIV